MSGSQANINVGSNLSPLPDAFLFSPPKLSICLIKDIALLLQEHIFLS